MNELDRLRRTFFEECDELLVSLQDSIAALLLPDGNDAHAQAIAAAFRAAHSIKGGAGAFGSPRLVAMAHVAETVFDAIRAGQLEPSAEVVNVLLRGGDALADLVAAERDGVPLADDAEQAVISDLNALLGAPASPEHSAAIPAVDPLADFAFPVIRADDAPPLPAAEEPAAPPALRTWTIDFAPTADVLAMGCKPLLIFQALRCLGPIQIHCHLDDLPPLEDLDLGASYLRWSISVTTNASPEAVAEPFAFIAPLSPPLIRADDGSQIAFDSLGVGRLPRTETIVAPPLVSVPVSVPVSVSVSVPPPQVEPPAEPPTDQPQELGRAWGGPAQPSSSIRVDVDRIDRLVNMVGELVITQAMLAQQAQGLPEERFPMLFQGLEDLASHTRELQESVMAIRAQPVKSAFARLPRLVRETAQALDKQVRLHIIGEETEVDKSVVEGLADPLMHLIRNAIDHGIESPEQRRALGKPEEGTITVAAEHRSGRIVIQVSDDGGGINLEAVKKKAIAQGLLLKGSDPTEDELYELLFHPGFSTVDLISNISGRGVGMDVVRANVNALGGRILVRSYSGRGTVFSLTLPLTLAVMEGMQLQAGGETYVLPIANIVESLKPSVDAIHTLVGRGQVLSVRGHYIPLVDLAGLFGTRLGGTDPAKALVVLAEAEDGGKIALMVDSLTGQQQVVIKSLERNFGHCDGISAATILGDGRVALILDVAGIRQLAGRRQRIEGAVRP